MATTRSNYGSYVPVDAVDWGKAIGGLYNTVNQIGLDREQQKKELDKLMTESISTINNSEMFKTQSLNDYVLAGAENGRTVINDANKRLKAGTIKPAEYRAIINNVNTYWSTMSNSMKNFDATNQELMKKIQPGPNGEQPEGSDFTAYLAENHANLGDLRNSKYVFNPDSGEGYMVKIDPATGKPEKVTNSLSIADPSNIMDPRFDFRGYIMKYTKGMMDAWLVEMGKTTENNPMKNDAVASSVISTINGLTTNPRMISQVLADFGGYDYYQSDSEKNGIIVSRINEENQIRKAQGKAELSDKEIENLTRNVSNSLIYVSPDDNNVLQPRPTREQEEEARNYLQDFAVAQFPYKQTEDEDTYKSKISVGGVTQVKVDNNTLSFAKKFVKAMGSGDKAEDELNKILKGDGRQVDWNGSGWDVYKYDPKKKNKDKYGTEGSPGGYVKTTYVDLNWEAENFAEALGYNKEKWLQAVKIAKGE